MPRLIFSHVTAILPDRLFEDAQVTCENGTVTDCNRALDQPPGRYRFGAESDGSWFKSDGKVGWAPNGSLASSIVGMDHMVRQMTKDTSATLPEIIRMASLTPAELTGIAKKTGSIAEGKSADLLMLNRKLEVRRVFIGGEELV